MKKILSLVAAFSMVATVASSFVTVSAATINPTVDVTATPLTDAEWAEYMEEEIAEGYAGYMLTVDMSDFGDLDYTKSGAKYSGRLLDTFSIDVYGLEEKADVDYTTTWENIFDQSFTEGWNDGGFFTGYSSGAVGACYPNKASSGINTIDNVVSIFVTAKTTEAFELDYKVVGCISIWTKGNAPASEDDMENFTVTGKVAFGEVVPPQPPVEEKTVWTSADDASIPADKQIIADVANVTGITKDTRVTVSNGSETKTFGNNIFAYLIEKCGFELAEDSTVDAEIRFAIMAPATANPADFTFEVK